MAALACVVARQDTFPVVCVRAVRLAEACHAVLDALRIALGAVVARRLISSCEEDLRAGEELVRVL